MTPTWTGLPGSPVPPELRHDFTYGPRCVRCGRVREIALTELCAPAVARRLAELEAHEASLHKHASRAVGAVVRWLRAMAEEGDDPWMSYCADAIKRGEHVEWREAHPDPKKATP